MAEPRTRRAIADDYQAARLAGDVTAMRPLQAAAPLRASANSPGPSLPISRETPRDP